MPLRRSRNAVNALLLAAGAFYVPGHKPENVRKPIEVAQDLAVVDAQFAHVAFGTAADDAGVIEGG